MSLHESVASFSTLPPLPQLLDATALLAEGERTCRDVRAHSTLPPLPTPPLRYPVSALLSMPDKETAE